MNSRSEISVLICNGEEVLSPRRWLAEEVASLALRIPNLDEIPSQATLPLAQLVVHGESEVKQLSLQLGIDEIQIGQYLSALCDFEFVEEVFGSFKATLLGEQAFDSIGQRMIDRELFEIKGRLQHLERLNRNRLVSN